MKPRVSLLVAAWNAGEFISDTIESVQAQTNKNWELIIVDDGSTDDTAEVVKKYASVDKRIKIFRQPNQGAHVARNYAFEKSCGDYIVILDADDRILPDKLKIQIDILDTNYQFGVVYGDTWHCDHLLKRVELESNKYPGQHISGDVFEGFVLGNRFAVHAGMVRRFVLEDVGLHCVDPMLIADWDFWVRVAEKYQFFYDSRPVAEYRIHAAMSANTDSARKQFNQRMGTAKNIEKLFRFNIISQKVKSNFYFANARFAQNFGLHKEAIKILRETIAWKPLNVKMYFAYIYSIYKLKRSPE